MTTTVYIVRHGQIESNLKDFSSGWSAEDLNENGYAQVRRLAARLANHAINAVYTSPLQRTLTTAKIIGDSHNLAPIIVNDLIEIKLGDWEGLHVSEIKEKWPKLFDRWRTDPNDVIMPSGESLDEVTARANRAINQIVDGNPDKNIIVVTHEIIIKVIITHILGCTNAIYNRFRIDNASISIVTNKDGNYQLLTLNDTAHLDMACPQVVPLL